MIGTSIIGQTFTVGGVAEEPADFTLVAEPLTLTLSGPDQIFDYPSLIADSMNLTLRLNPANLTGSAGNSGPVTGLEIVVLKSRLISNITLRSRL